MKVTRGGVLWEPQKGVNFVTKSRDFYHPLPAHAQENNNYKEKLKQTQEQEKKTRAEVSLTWAHNRQLC